MGAKATNFVEKYFPERQFYFRSRATGEVRYIALGPAPQIGACLFGIAAAAWILAASLSLIFEHDRIVAAETKAGEISAENRDLKSTIRVLEGDVIDEAKQLKAKQDYLQSVIAERLGAEAAAEEQPGTAGEETGAANQTSETTAPATGEEHSSDEVSIARRIIASLGLATMPASASAPDADRHSIAYANSLQQLGTVERQTRRTAQALIRNTQEDIDALTAVFETAGIAPADILEMNEPETAAPDENMGGPYQPVNAAEEDAWSGDPTFAELRERLAYLEKLKTVRQSVPVGTPVDHYYISSDFGKRRDPYTKRRSWHSALDMAGVWKTPVRPQADGKVVFAGWNGPYGRMIEIDHGNGVRTRYGHLAKIKVEEGQRITAGDVIGLMGNSGRTTGTHLHYEIWFKDEVLDPANFIKASKHVAQKNG